MYPALSLLTYLLSHMFDLVLEVAETEFLEIRRLHHKPPQNEKKPENRNINTHLKSRYGYRYRYEYRHGHRSMYG